MIDPNSETWKTVEAWALKHIETARDRLEGGVLPPNGTGSPDGLSGRCGALRELLSLAKPKPGQGDGSGETYHA